MNRGDNFLMLNKDCQTDSLNIIFPHQSSVGQSFAPTPSMEPMPTTTQVTTPPTFTTPYVDPPFGTKAPKSGFAILQTAVQSYQELNETTVDPVLSQLYHIIRAQQPDLNIRLTVKTVQKV
ncbi:hypothetical protein J4Q44_G00267450 [Coregonus suidteri]|uniref:Uncharacterized protein n=1 Tax=Coregonus suidteri TaxID=861788 RepID=A0AAN8QF84_9TELE